MIARNLLDQLVSFALWEDLAGGDPSSEATVDEEELAVATAFAKDELVLSGGEVFSQCFHAVDGACRVERLVDDGDLVPAGTALLRAEGPARSLLMAERTALNFLQRLSGTATLTRRFVAATTGTTRIADTRKTTPGLRALEKEAVRHGGGHNHRFDLGSAVMIKDNHIAASGGLGKAVERAQARAPHTCRIEVEVQSLEELAEALEAGADIIMLDNFDDAAIEKAVTLTNRRALIEVSGNISIARVPGLCRLGVDVISVGALTHSAPASDISLQLVPLSESR